MASTCEHAHGSSAPEPRRAAGRAGSARTMRRPQPPSLRQHRRHDDSHGLVDTLKRPTRKDSAQSVIAAECPESNVFHYVN